MFLDLPPGSYVLEASASGFSVIKSEPFTLVVNQTATLDLSLTVGSVTQTVTVEATTTQVQASTSELGAVVSTREAVDLPLNGRNFTQLLTLTPGASPISVSSNSGGFTSQPVGSFAFPSINGQTNRSNYFMLDGAFNMSGWGQSTYAVAPIPDTIQEFKVQSHNDEAEFGGVMGGIVNVVTKGGTNELHGDLWEFLRNDAFDARNFFQPNVTPYRWNMFGASAGGPVVLPKLYNGRSRTFFMLGYQGFRLREPAQSLYRVPTAGNLSGDLSDLGVSVYNPFTTRPNPSVPGTYIRDPFPNNQIPSSMLDPTMDAFLNWLPKPNASGPGDRNLRLSTPTRQNEDDYTARIDQTIGSKDFLWFRYSGAIQDLVGTGGLNTSGNVDFRSKNISASWTRTINPSSVFQAQFSRVNVTLNQYSELINSSQSVIQGFDPSWVNGYHSLVKGPKVPEMDISGWFNTSSFEQLDQPMQSTWQGRATFTKMLGGHTFKMGGEFSSSGYYGYVLNGVLTFAAFNTADPNNPGNTGHQLASMLLDVPDSATRRDSIEPENFGGVWGVFFQDQWKVTPRLTVNVGLRYDYTIIPNFGSKKNGTAYVGNMDFNSGIYTLQYRPPACQVTNAAPCIPTPGGVLPAHVAVSPNGKVFDNWENNWGPRLGVAYRLSNKTAIRSGFGIFYDNWAAFNQSAQGDEGTWPGVSQEIRTNLNRPNPEQAIPTVKGTYPGFVAGLPDPTPFNQFTWFADPHSKAGYSMQWNFGVQQMLGDSTMLTVNYVGSGSRRLPLGGVYNTATTPGPGDYRQRQLIPYAVPSYFDRTWGRSNYDGLQVSLERRLASGFTHLLAYTWSKVIDIGCSGWYGFEGCSVQDQYHFDNDRSVAGFDITHLFSYAFVYDLPFGRSKRFSSSRAANYLIGSWQLNGILTLRSGQPFDLSAPGDIANVGNGSERPDLVGHPYPARQTPDQWLVRSAFAFPQIYTFGNLGRNVFRSDWGRNLDFSLFRNFPIRESLKLQFRAEAFNLTNTPVFGIPDGSIGDTSFGQVFSTANRPRLLQLALKLLF
jgi:hypothetical protein